MVNTLDEAQINMAKAILKAKYGIDIDTLTLDQTHDLVNLIFAARLGME